MAHLLTAYGVAFLLAAQVGPITLLIVRSIVRGGRAVVIGLLTAAAVAGVDLVYATVGLAGIGRLLEGRTVRLVLGLVTAAILIVIGARSIWFGVRARLELALADQVQPRRAFQTAIVATALNPLNDRALDDLLSGCTSERRRCVGRFHVRGAAGRRAGRTQLVLRVRAARRRTARPAQQADAQHR